MSFFDSEDYSIFVAIGIAVGGPVLILCALHWWRPNQNQNNNNNNNNPQENQNNPLEENAELLPENVERQQSLDSNASLDSSTPVPLIASQQNHSAPISRVRELQQQMLEKASQEKKLLKQGERRRRALEQEAKFYKFREDEKQTLRNRKGPSFSAPLSRAELLPSEKTVSPSPRPQQPTSSTSVAELIRSQDAEFEAALEIDQQEEIFRQIKEQSLLEFQEIQQKKWSERQALARHVPDEPSAESGDSTNIIHLAIRLPAKKKTRLSRKFTSENTVFQLLAFVESCLVCDDYIENFVVFKDHPRQILQEMDPSTPLSSIFSSPSELIYVESKDE